VTKASDNAYPSILITEGTEPSAPAAGKQRLYIDSTTHKLKRTDSSGVDVTIEGAGITNLYVGSPQALGTLGTSVATALAADRVYITKFVPTADVTVATAAWNCATSAGNLDLGIYNEALSSKLGSTGAFASPGTGKRTQALTGSVALTAGTVYYLAFWSNNASLLVTTSVLPGAAGFGTWNLVGIQSSVSTNLPASITATWDPGAIAAPIFYFIV
jgi:hypothetical protein